MLRTKPVLKYCGITIILQNPSRDDRLSLCTGSAGVLVNEILQPDYNIMQCDIRLADDISPFLEGTKVIILCGEYAMHTWWPDSRKNTLNELRGSPFYINNIPAIATFFPQDCADYKAYESMFNEESHDYTGENENDKQTEDEAASKRQSRTKRANYAFWLKQDFGKCKRLLRQDSQRWVIEDQPIYKIFPSSEEVITTLKNFKNHYLEYDMETDLEEQNKLCFSFSFWDGVSDSLACPVYSVPILNENYQLAYSAWANIHRALWVGITNNIVVAHNGHTFDFIVDALKYKIPIRRAVDTMKMMHRCYPDVERSLGHCVSLWTNQRFHKDEAAYAYRTREHMMNHLKYCGKDVFTMWLCHKAMSRYAKTIPGLEASMELANRSIRPYITSTIQGIRYDQKQVDKLKNENDRLMMQYLRIINMLIGEHGIKESLKAVKKSSGAIASSTKRLVNYFHYQLEYPVVMRSKDTGLPILGKKQLYQLQLKHPDNWVIAFINMYREIQKEYGALNFFPFKDDNNNLIPYAENQTD